MEHRSPVDHLHPEPLMDQPMMRPAQQNQVGHRGGSSVGPVLDVVCITPSMRTVAARESATAVPDHHGSAQGSRHHGGAAPHLERLRPSDGDDPGDGGIAGPPPGGLRGDGACRRAHTGSRSALREMPAQAWWAAQHRKRREVQRHHHPPARPASLRVLRDPHQACLVPRSAARRHSRPKEEWDRGGVTPVATRSPEPASKAHGNRSTTRLVSWL